MAEYLLALGTDWIDAESTVDRFVAGDPSVTVTGIAVACMSYTWALQQALDLGCNLFVTHEPTFFSGRDDEERIFRFDGAAEKRRWLRESGMAVFRCHDLWDQFPVEGIPDSWGALLGLGFPTYSDGYFRLFKVDGHTTESLARQVAAGVRRYAQDAVEVIGPERAITRVATGTGAITPFTQLLDLYSPDLVICSDDGFTYWHAGALAVDLGIPAIVVNHAVSELHGIELLARHLERQFPDVPIHHIPQTCMYRLVSP